MEDPVDNLQHLKEQSVSELGILLEDGNRSLIHNSIAADGLECCRSIYRSIIRQRA